MFASVGDGGNEGDGVSGSILIPKLFVWPYGGTRVSLIGSFTRYRIGYYNGILNLLIFVLSYRAANCDCLSF